MKPNHNPGRGQSANANNGSLLVCRNLIWLLLILAATACIILLAGDTFLVSSQAARVPENLRQWEIFIEDNNKVGEDNMQRTDSNSSKVKTQVPVIGILTQVLRDFKRFTKEHHLHIASSYVKWVESAGAQAIPILLNQDEAYYERVFKQTNGLLLPGGDNLLDPHKSTPMMVAAKRLYRLAKEANDRGDFYPIWGTCLGLELLTVLSSNRNTLDSCFANDMTLGMEFVGRGKLFAPTEYSNLNELSQDYSKVIVDILASKNLTYNFHRKCLTDEGLRRANLETFYRPLAHSEDKNSTRFITIFEAIDYPFYGVQFHPEKPPFEFVFKESQLNIPHSRESIAVSRFFADFFVGQAQQNGHQIKLRDIQHQLIYAYNPMYTALKDDMYEQRYLFPFGDNRFQLNLEEFIDHIPAPGEEMPEEVTKEDEGHEGELATAAAANNKLNYQISLDGFEGNNNYLHLSFESTI